MSEEYIMKPKVDFAFKELMRDENIRAGFLSAVLSLPLKDIKKTRLLGTFLRKERKKDKLGILDVRVLLNDKTEIDIEIQVSPFEEWKKRSIYYWSKLYSDSLRESEGYNKLKQCVSISILDFVLLQDEKEFFSCYQLMETSRHTVYTDIMKFYIIELPKLVWEKSIPKGKDIYLWARFLASERKEEMEMLAKASKQISSAYNRLKIISSNDRKKMEYEARQRAIRDAISLEEQYRNNGLREGREQGLAQGLEQGLEQGLDLLNSLYATLTEEGRFEEIKRCIKDEEYRSKLLKEYKSKGGRKVHQSASLIKRRKKQ